jgi:hypothetical protein
MIGDEPFIEWTDASRGMAQIPRLIDEFHTRTFWRSWQALLDGRYPIAPVATPETSAVEATAAAR